ncbi:MAG: lactonase family protein [Vicinamibacterales bacterium]|nr:lactonase family protein [Vicinamibacterales bacterium]
MLPRLLRTVTVVTALASTAAPGMPARAAQVSPAEYFVYFGTYNRTAGKGIYAYRFQPATGALASLGLAAETPHPSFLAVHPNRRFLYAVNEHEGEDLPGKNNTVSAFAIEPTTGKLTFLNKVSSRGEGPCHLSIDKTGRMLLVANYRSGSVVVLPIHPDGELGEATAFDQHQGKSIDPVRQAGPHAHFILPSPDNRFALTADLGLDQVVVYRFEASRGRLAPNDPPFAAFRPGTGPRHLAFHPAADAVYVNGEIASTVTAFTYNAKAGTLGEFQTISTLPAGFAGSSTTAEIQIDRAGRFLYVSNRGHNSIAMFAIDKATKKLALVEHVPTGGNTPRYFTFDPTGSYLLVANQGSNTVVVHRVDANTGRITPVRTLTDVPEPVSIVFVPVKR